MPKGARHNRRMKLSWRRYAKSKKSSQPVGPKKSGVIWKQKRAREGRKRNCGDAPKRDSERGKMKLRACARENRRAEGLPMKLAGALKRQRGEALRKKRGARLKRERG